MVIGPDEEKDAELASDQRYRAETELFVNSPTTKTKPIQWEFERTKTGSLGLLHPDAQVGGDDNGWDRVERLVDRIAEKQLLAAKSTRNSTMQSSEQRSVQHQHDEANDQDQRSSSLQYQADAMAATLPAIKKKPLISPSNGVESRPTQLLENTVSTTTSSMNEERISVASNLRSERSNMTDILDMSGFAGLDSTSNVTSSQLAEQSQLLDKRVAAEGTGGRISPAVLQAIRQQMAVSLQRMRELEEQVSIF